MHASHCELVWQPPTQEYQAKFLFTAAVSSCSESEGLALAREAHEPELLYAGTAGCSSKWVWMLKRRGKNYVLTCHPVAWGE